MIGFGISMNASAILKMDIWKLFQILLALKLVQVSAHSAWLLLKMTYCSYE